MIDHLHKLVQHSNRTFPIEQRKGRAGISFLGGKGRGGKGGVAKRNITGYSSDTFFSTKGGGWDTDLITDTHYRPLLFFLSSHSVTFLIFFAFAQLYSVSILAFCVLPPSAKGGILNSIPF